MSKRISKLSRRGTNKCTQDLKAKSLDKSSDDFEEVKPISRYPTRNDTSNKIKMPRYIDDQASSLSIHSVCKKLSAHQGDDVNKSEKLNSNLGNRNDSNKIRHEDQNKKCYSNISSRSSSEAENGDHPNAKEPENIDAPKEKVHSNATSSESKVTCDRNEEQQLINNPISNVPPCPLCGKTFKLSNEGKRTSHLKECGTTHGVDAQDLVKMRRLEEKQAAEWKALGLPKMLASVPKLTETNLTNNRIVAKVSNAGKAQTHKRKCAKQSKTIITESSGDPNLEMALALSASLAQTEPNPTITNPELHNNNKQDIVASKSTELHPKDMEKSKCKENSDKVPNVIMPDASCWWKKPTSPSKRNVITRRANSRKKGPTKLELTSDQERNREISDKVAHILIANQRVQNDIVRSSSVINDNGKDFQFNTSPQRVRMRQWWKKLPQEGGKENKAALKVGLWEQSKQTHDVPSYCVDSFQAYQSLRCKTKQPSIHEPQERTKEEQLAITSSNTSSYQKKNTSHENMLTKQLCSDFEDLFDSGKRTDLTIFAKNERPIKCHTLVLFARCRCVLDDLIKQKTESGEESILCWDSYDYSVVSGIVRYLYSGKPPNDIKSKKIWDQHKQLAIHCQLSEYVNSLKGYDKTDFEEEMSESDSCYNQAEETGGFMDENLDFEGNRSADGAKESQTEGATQNLDSLIKVFEANFDKTIDMDANLSDHISSRSKTHGQSNCYEDDEWEEVHWHLTQKHTLPPMKQQNPYAISEEEPNTPEKHKIEVNLQQSPGTYSQARSDSPDMFADEDDTEKETRISPVYEKSMKNYGCGSPLTSNISSCQHDDKDTLKLSTPVDFSDNELFDEVLQGSQQNYSFPENEEVLLISHQSNTRPNSKKEMEETSTSITHTSRLISNSDEYVLISRILEIRSQLKSTNSINDKTIEIFLQELLSMQGVDINVLLKTGIGKTIKDLIKKYPNGIINRKADLLISRWSMIIHQHAELQENENTNTPISISTPIKAHHIDKIDITPRPNYESMATPIVNRELHKYGVKNMAKNKAIPLLDLIYNETHPSINKNIEDSDKERMYCFNESSGSSSTSEDDINEREVMEESILLTNIHPDIEPDILTQQSQQNSGFDGNLRDLIMKYIKSDLELYRKCLTYEPIWLEQFFSDFKTYALVQNFNPKQVKLNLVINILDNECITFRTNARANRNKAMNEKTKQRKAKQSTTRVKTKQGKKRLSSTQSEKTSKRKKSSTRLSSTQF